MYLREAAARRRPRGASHRRLVPLLPRGGAGDRDLFLAPATPTSSQRRHHRPHRRRL